MARELVNLSTDNERLREQAENYPLLKEQYKVGAWIHGRHSAMTRILLGIGSTVRCLTDHVWREAGGSRRTSIGSGRCENALSGSGACSIVLREDTRRSSLLDRRSNEARISYAMIVTVDGFVLCIGPVIGLSVIRFSFSFSLSLSPDIVNFIGFSRLLLSFH